MKDALSATFIKFLSGAIACLIFVAITIGPENMGDFIVMSLLCSFGTIIAPWLIISYLVGFVIDEFIFMQFFRKSEHRWSLHFRGFQSNEEAALTTYIRDAKKYYMSDDTIRNTLLESGWDKKLINRAFNMI